MAEAILRCQPDPPELQFLYDGILVYGRRWPSRAEAETEAAARLRELQVRGWTTHW